MNWSTLQHSLLLAYGVAKLSVYFGCVAAIWCQCLQPRANAIVTGIAAIALALPPFLVANTWMHFFGLAGVWRKYIDFDIYSWGGAILLMTLLMWPVTFFIVRASLARLETERLEIDPQLHGWRVWRWTLWPHLRASIGVATLVTFVLALNHFTIPALLQTKVFSNDVWVAFNSTFDYRQAIIQGWPLVVAPLLLLLAVRNRLEIWPAQRPLDATRLAHVLGQKWTWPSGIVSIGLLLVSAGFPLGHLVATSSAWKQMGTAFAAGHTAFSASLVTSLGGATVALAASIALSKRRWQILAWLPFLIPGVLLGIAVIRIFNQPGLNWIYPSLLMVVGVLGARYLALPLNTVAQARRSLDPDLIAAARTDGATATSAFWKTEFPLLAGPLFFAWYLGYLFCLWDAETMVMIVPPGGETLSLRVFNMLHYGHTEQVNALCLWLLILAVAPLAIRSLIAKRKLLAPGLAMLVCASCSGPPPGSTPVKSQIFSHVEVIGHRGNGVGEFNKPRSVAVDKSDNLYVVDMTGRVQKFSPSGQYLLSWQMPMTDKGKPKGMALDSDGSVIVVEPHYSRVNYYKPDGSLEYQWGKEGTNAGQLIFPRSIAVNSVGEVYVSEYGLAERVQRFSPRGTNLLNVIGAAGEGDGEFRRAEGIGVDSKDRLFVADSCNHRIEVFSREGKFLRQHGHAGSGPNEMSYPYDVRVDKSGFEYVCEFGNSRVQIFDGEGRLVEILGGVGGDPGQMNNPWAICLDSKGNLYVADSGNHRVQKFTRKQAVATTGAGNGGAS